MFLRFYGLREQPFGATPDPRFLYLSASHREAMASLRYGIEAGRGFLAMIAKPGMGKTTLLFQLLERLHGYAKTSFVFQTQCAPRELVCQMLEDAGIDTSGKDLVRLHREFDNLLATVFRSGKQFVVVIDEAQNLDDASLEAVRLLSDFETRRTKLLQIVLSGQPQLAERLASPSLSQLRQRISLFCRLKPLSREETERYIEHRLRTAGYRGARIFTAEALDLIAQRSQGIPRNINNLCFNAMSLAWALERREVDREILQEVACDLDLETLCSPETSGSPSDLSLNGRAASAPRQQDTAETAGAAQAVVAEAAPPGSEGTHTLQPVVPAAHSMSAASTQEPVAPGANPPPEPAPGSANGKFHLFEHLEYSTTNANDAARRSLRDVVYGLIGLTVLAFGVWTGQSTIREEPPLATLPESGVVQASRPAESLLSDTVDVPATRGGNAP